MLKYQQQNVASFTEMWSIWFAGEKNFLKESYYTHFLVFDFYSGLL